MSRKNAIAKQGFDVVSFSDAGAPATLEEHRRFLDLLAGKPTTGPPGLLTVQEVATLLRCSVSSLNKWRLFGNGPTFIKVGSRVRYRLSDIALWVARESRNSTSQPIAQTEAQPP
jgi:hypothetical protein